MKVAKRKRGGFFHCCAWRVVLMPTAAKTKTDRLVTREELLTCVPLSYAKIWELMREDRFPLPRRISDFKKTRHLAKTVEDANVKDVKPAAKTEDFDATVAKIRERDGCDGQTALQKARRENPVGFEKSRTQNVPITHGRPIAKKGIAEFMSEVSRTMIEKKLTRSAAMADVRKRSPQLYEAFQEV
jgi:predicted DNA-binding transcriptional regulator AlpA